MLRGDRYRLVKARMEGKQKEGKGKEGKEDYAKKLLSFPGLNTAVSPAAFLKWRHYQSSQATVSEVGRMNNIGYIGVQKSFSPDAFSRTKFCPYIMAQGCHGFSL